MAKRSGFELEEEMSRFEQEISGQSHHSSRNHHLPLPMPPPPKQLTKRINFHRPTEPPRPPRPPLQPPERPQSHQETTEDNQQTDQPDHNQPQAHHHGVMHHGAGGFAPPHGFAGPMPFPMMPPMGPRMGLMAPGMMPMPPMPMPPMPMQMPMPMAGPLGPMPMMPMMPMPPGSSVPSSATSSTSVVPSSAPPKIQYQTGTIKGPTVPIPGYDSSTNPMAVGDLSDLLETSQPSVQMTSGMAPSSGSADPPKKKKFVRIAGGTVWEDETLQDWDTNDFRIFVGDIGNEVTDDALLRAFNQYPSLLKAKIIRDKKTKKTKGYGFVSFKDPQDYLRAMKEMNGRYVGNRPIKLRKSSWKDRNIFAARKKEKEKKKLGIK